MTAYQLAAYALLAAFWAYCVLYCAWETRERRAPLINGETMKHRKPGPPLVGADNADDRPIRFDPITRLFDQAEYEAAAHGHEVVAEAEAILRGAV